MSKDWQPTPEDFDRFLLWLDPDRDAAGERYERIYRMLATFFAARRRGDANSLADETINRVMRQVVVAKESVENAEAYCRGVANNVLRESYRDPLMEKIVPFDTLTPTQLPASPQPQEQREVEADAVQYELYLEMLRRCLEELPRLERAMVVSYYAGSEEGELKRKRQELARQLDINICDLRSRMARRRERLRKCVEKHIQSTHPA